MKKSIIIFIIVGGLIILAVFLLFSQIRKTDNVSIKDNSEIVASIGEKAPEVIFTTLNGKTMKLSQFEGKPVMFWLIATWCPTCKAGASVLNERISEIEKYNLQIITLKIYNNLGYPGPSIDEFAKEWAGKGFGHPNWVWTEASKETSFIYDPKGFPDIYYLIDKQGIIQAKDTAPSATINKIIEFAKSQS